MSCEPSTGRRCGSIAEMIDHVSRRDILAPGLAKPTSLADLGYNRVGIDEGWEGCGQGVGGTQLDAHGNPVANAKRFPDLAELLEYGECSRGRPTAIDVVGRRCRGAFRELHVF